MTNFCHMLINPVVSRVIQCFCINIQLKFCHIHVTNHYKGCYIKGLGVWQICDKLILTCFCLVWIYNIHVLCIILSFLHIYCVIFLSHRDAQMWQMTFLYMFLQIYYRQICHLSHRFVTWDKNVTKLKSWNPYSPRV